MRAEGLLSLVDQSDLAVMGFVEVLPRIPRVLSHLNKLVTRIGQDAPVAVVTIDSWGFTGRLQKKVAKAYPNIKRIHYVAPMVWVWKEKRAASVARIVQHLLCLFPHELPYFERYGLACTHVGHPLVTDHIVRLVRQGFRERYAIDQDVPVLCLLPGSRQGEVARLLPILKDVAVRLSLRFPRLAFVMPVVATVEEQVRREISTWPVRVVCVLGEQERYSAFSESSAAIAASGSVTLELARFGVPHGVVYKVSSVTAWLFKRLRRMSFVNLINIALDRLVVPELLQEECTADNVISHVETLLFDNEVRGMQCAYFDHAFSVLGGGQRDPAACAARCILEAIDFASLPDETSRGSLSQREHQNVLPVFTCDDPRS